MISLIRSGLFLVNVLVLQACGVAVDSHSNEFPDDYVTYDLFEYDDFERTKTWLTTDCINLDRSWEDGRVDVENRFEREMSFGWRLRDENIEFLIEDADGIVSKVKYDTDFFRNGSSVEQKVVLNSGEPFLVRLSGPSCDRD